MPAPSRLAQPVRRAARPVRRLLPFRPRERGGAGPPALHPRNDDARDDLAYADGLADRARPAGGGPDRERRARRRYRRVPGDDRARARCCESRRARRPRRGGKSTACPCSTTAAPKARGSTTARATTSCHRERRRPSGLELNFASGPSVSPAGARRCRPGESVFVALSWGDHAPADVEEALASYTRPRGSGVTGCAPATMPDHRGARISSAAPSRSRA